MQRLTGWRFTQKLANGLLHLLFSLFVVAVSCWLCLALWIQMPLGNLFTPLLIVLWLVFSCVILGIYFSRAFISRPIDFLIFIVGFLLGLAWYFNIQPRQDRDWNPEVARILDYQRHGHLVTLNNVRNFRWHQDGTFEQHWQTRHIDLNKITGVNMVASYWMGPQIAHTLVSFDFADQQPLVFSLEIRKEKTEDFSAIGGFFRKYELSLIAADEQDIIFTRSNVRHEQVYFFPIDMPKQQLQELFLEYLQTSDRLREQPSWYNTLTSNCTTIVFDMVRAILQQPFPKDYRIILSGYLPNYLYDHHVLDHHWSMQTWYQKAHINPRTANFHQGVALDGSSLDTSKHPSNFSALVRQGLPLNSKNIQAQ
ncbi:MAG: DUF4105 domain-containing protein [Acinetobacter sp.]